MGSFLIKRVNPHPLAPPPPYLHSSPRRIFLSPQILSFRPVEEFKKKCFLIFPFTEFCSYSMEISLIAAPLAWSAFSRFLDSNFCIRIIFLCHEVSFFHFYFFLLKNFFLFFSGNHESQVMNQMYGFEGEVRSKYSPQMSDLFTEVYNWLPLCHLINKKILVKNEEKLRNLGNSFKKFNCFFFLIKVMHGGLFSEDGVKLDDLRKIDRNRQPPESGPMCDLLWSDPQPQQGRSPSKRGVGCQFGPDVTEKFLKENNLQYVVR